MVMLLQAEGCQLVPLQPQHEASYIALANHPQIRERVNNIIPYKKKQFDELLALGAREPRSFTWMIVADDALCGVVTTGATVHPQRFQGGYWIDPEYWGRGLATTAVKCANQFLFERCDVIRIQAVVEPDNLASIAVLIKAGYSCEGLLRKFYPSRYRGLIDVYMYAMIRTVSQN